MTSTTATTAGPANAADPAQPASGPFILTLCRLPGPVTIRPSQSPQLKPYTFFTSRARAPDGTEQLYLHMGYFEKLADAQRWLPVMRPRYPAAVATVAPVALMQQSNSGVPTVQPAGGAEETRFAPVGDESLTDTQVMNILEKRNATSHRESVSACDNAQIALLRPEDTQIRQSLKEAVVQGALVSFAVQLEWSAEPINMSRVPALGVFKGHTLYTTESQRDGRSCFFLRLGFFPDAITAREVGQDVRSSFPSSAVVPVTEQERAHADGARIDTASLAHPLKRRLDFGFSLDRLRAAATPWSSAARSTTAQSTKTAPVNAAAKSAPKSRRSSEAAGDRPQTLEQTLETLAQSESWDPDSLTETGVRHLSIAVEKRRR
jgi:hypothetical protein